MDTPIPMTGDLFARDGMDRIFALVVLPERETEDGWLCYAILLYPNGGLSAPQMVEILPTDRHICQDFPMSFMAQLAYTRALQIRERLS